MGKCFETALEPECRKRWKRDEEARLIDEPSEPPKADATKETDQFLRRVLLQVEARRNFIEVSRDIVRPGEATWRDADVEPTRHQGTTDLPELIEGIIRMQVLHQLVAECHRDAALRPGMLEPSEIFRWKETVLNTV